MNKLTPFGKRAQKVYNVCTDKLITNIQTLGNDCPIQFYDLAVIKQSSHSQLLCSMMQ